jgi:hypothetical protein
MERLRAVLGGGGVEESVDVLYAFSFLNNFD